MWNMDLFSAAILRGGKTQAVPGKLAIKVAHDAHLVQILPLKFGCIYAEPTSSRRYATPRSPSKSPPIVFNPPQGVCNSRSRKPSTTRNTKVSGSHHL